MNLIDFSDEALIRIFVFLKTKEIGNFACCRRFYSLTQGKTGQRIFQERCENEYSKYLSFKINIDWKSFYQRVYLTLNKNKNHLITYITSNLFLEFKVLAENKKLIKELLYYSVIYGKITMCMYLQNRYKEKLNRYLPGPNYVSLAVVSGHIDIYEWLLNFYPEEAHSNSFIINVAIEHSYNDIFDKYFANSTFVHNEKLQILDTILKYDRYDYLEKLYNSDFGMTNMNIDKIYEYGSHKILKWLHKNNKVAVWPVLTYDMFSYCICKSHLQFLEYYLYEISPESTPEIKENTVLVIIFNDRLSSLIWLQQHGFLKSITNNMITEAIKYFRFTIFKWFFQEFKDTVLNRENFEYICMNGSHPILEFVIHNSLYDMKNANLDDLIDFLEIKIKDTIYSNDLINFRKVISLLNN